MFVPTDEIFYDNCTIKLGQGDIFPKRLIKPLKNDKHFIGGL